MHGHRAKHYWDPLLESWEISVINQPIYRWEKALEVKYISQITEVLHVS